MSLLEKNSFLKSLKYYVPVMVLFFCKNLKNLP